MPNATVSASSQQYTEEEMQVIEENLHLRWPAISLGKQYEQEGRCAALERDGYKKLTDLLGTYMNWKNRLNMSSGLMINELCFKDLSFRRAIESHQKETGVLPYVKEHEYRGKIYVSFGEENVKLADEIIHDLTDVQSFKYAKTILSRLKAAYKAVRTQADARALQLDREFALKKSTLSTEERDTLGKELVRANEEGEMFSQQLEEVKKDANQFSAYYSSVVAKVEQEAGIRSLKFQEDNNVFFEDLEEETSDSEGA